MRKQQLKEVYLHLFKKIKLTMNEILYNYQFKVNITEQYIKFLNIIKFQHK